MKYFYDCEFLEGKQKECFPVSLFRKETKPTIDLISIGIVAEDGREYYAISKDFNLKEAWNRFQLRQVSGDVRNIFPEGVKEYWLRENVLKPILKELAERDGVFAYGEDNYFTYKVAKRLVSKYGKTNKEIAEEVINFIGVDSNKELHKTLRDKYHLKSFSIGSFREGIEMCPPKFYGYYSAYDHVVLCWLFGKMNDLPNGFPMYTIDLQQELDRLNETLGYDCDEKGNSYKIQTHPNYPKQTNEHSAIHDARWNKKLYEFLNTL